MTANLRDLIPRRGIGDNTNLLRPLPPPVNPMTQAILDHQASRGLAVADGQAEVLRKRDELEQVRIEEELERRRAAVEEIRERRERRRQFPGGSSPQQPGHDPLVKIFMDQNARLAEQLQAAQLKAAEQTREEMRQLREMVAARNSEPAKDPVTMLREMIALQSAVAELAKVTAPPPPQIPEGRSPRDLIEIMKADVQREIEMMRLSSLREDKAAERELRRAELGAQVNRDNQIASALTTYAPPYLAAAMGKVAEKVGIGGGPSTPPPVPNGQIIPTVVPPQFIEITCPNCTGPMTVLSTQTSAPCPHCGMTVIDETARPGVPPPDNVLRLPVAPPQPEMTNGLSEYHPPQPPVLAKAQSAVPPPEAESQVGNAEGWVRW